MGDMKVKQVDKNLCIRIGKTPDILNCEEVNWNTKKVDMIHLFNLAQATKQHVWNTFPFHFLSQILSRHFATPVGFPFLVNDKSLEVPWINPL